MSSVPRSPSRSISGAFFGWCRAWVDAWDRFFFTPSGPRHLAAIRIATGVLCTWSCLVWLMDVEGFFGDAGWLRADEVWRMNDQPWQWSWYFVTTSPELRLAAAIVALIAAIALTIGLATPVAAWFSLGALVSAANRAPLNIFGFDDILGILLISLAIGPAGRAWSLDNRLFARGLRGQGGAGRGETGEERSIRGTIAIRILQLTLCVIYFFSGCGKLLGPSWWEGTALWGSVANGQYRTLDLTWMADHTWLVNLITLSTLFWEVSYAAIVWPRLTRPIALAMAVFVHLGIGLAMGMMEFGLAMIVANMAFAGPLFSDETRSRPAAER